MAEITNRIILIHKLRTWKNNNKIKTPNHKIADLVTSIFFFFILLAFPFFTEIKVNQTNLQKAEVMVRNFGKVLPKGHTVKYFLKLQQLPTNLVSLGRCYLFILSS